MSILPVLTTVLTAVPGNCLTFLITQPTGRDILRTASPLCAVRQSTHFGLLSVSLDIGKRESSVRHVCLCQFVCPCDCRTETLHSLTQGQSALFREIMRNSSGILTFGDKNPLTTHLNGQFIERKQNIGYLIRGSLEQMDFNRSLKHFMIHSPVIAAWDKDFLPHLSGCNSYTRILAPADQVMNQFPSGRITIFSI